MNLSLRPGLYINIIGKKSKRYFTFKLNRLLKVSVGDSYKLGIWKAEKYVSDMNYYEPDHEFNAFFELKHSTQVKSRKTRICEIFDFTTNKIKFYCEIEK